MQNNGRVLLVRTFVFGSLLHNRKLSITFGVQQKGVAHEMLLSQIHSDPLECFHSAYIQPSSKSRKVHIFSFQMYNKILESFFNSSADGYYFQYCVIITMTQNSSRCGSLFSVAILLSMCYCFDLLRLLRKPRRFPGLLDLRATMSKYFEAGKPRWPGNVEVIAIGFPDVWKKDKILEVLVNLLVCVSDVSSAPCSSFM